MSPPTKYENFPNYLMYARLGPASGLTPNPFSKRVTLSAGERTKKAKSQTLMSVLNTKPCCHKTRTYTVNNNKLANVRSYEKLLDYTKGYFLLSKCCDDIGKYVDTVADGLYSYIDVNCLETKQFTLCGTPDYVIDPCRCINGLIVPRGKIKPTHKERKMQFPVPIKKLNDCECGLPPCNNCTLPNIHDICDNTWHCHYFPTNSGLIYYSHKHKNEEHPEGPYPHPNFDATNKTSYIALAKYDSASKYGKKRKYDFTKSYDADKSTVISYINTMRAQKRDGWCCDPGLQPDGVLDGSPFG